MDIIEQIKGMLDHTKLTDEQVLELRTFSRFITTQKEWTTNAPNARMDYSVWKELYGRNIITEQH